MSNPLQPSQSLNRQHPAIRVATHPATQVSLAGVVGAGAAAILLSFVPTQEGTKYRAYQDIAAIWTICDGKTRGVHAGQVETPAQCTADLETELARHSAPVIACTPTLKKDDGQDYQIAAAASMAYNVGDGAYCRSTAHLRFVQRQWLAGCVTLVKYNRAGGNFVRGLDLRRRREIQICVTGLLPYATPENLQSRIKAIR